MNYGCQYPWKRCECVNPWASAQHTCVGVNPCVKAGPVCMCEGVHLCGFSTESFSSKFRGCFIFFKTCSYLSSSILPGVFSHDKNYLYIIYIYRFAAFPHTKDSFTDSVFLFSSLPSSSLPVLPFFYKDSNMMALSLCLFLPPHFHCLVSHSAYKFSANKTSLFRGSVRSSSSNIFK